MSRQFFELILAVKRKCQSNEEQIQEELCLAPAQFSGLMVLEDGQEITGCEFARRMALSPSRGSRVLNALAADGYVKTRSGPGDRRAVLISLTPKGKRTRQRIVSRMEACESRICGRLDQKRVAQVKNALELLEAAL
jgi:DNA-binding MarR family transcriptional regulator